jgi:hypothetical protein
MTSTEPFVVMLAGGHPNSLGRTIEVVDVILSNQSQLEQLYQCYFSDDEVVRLRTSNAMKRIWREQPEWLVPYIDRFLEEISQIDQASTRWTLAQLFFELEKWLSPSQKQKAVEVMKKNFAESNDWIVINNTLEALGKWSEDDPELKNWLQPYVVKYAADSRKSVAGKASKLLKHLYKD